jgi:RND family efflux transporter MFP subunit
MNEEPKNEKSAVKELRRAIVENFKDRRAASEAFRNIIHDNFKDKKLTVVTIRVILCAGVLIFALLVSGTFALFSSTPQRRPPSELVKVLLAVPVKLGEVKLKLSGYGTVEPIQEVTLSSELQGRVTMKSVDLKAGQLVKKGQILAKIDAIDYEIALQKATAVVTRLRAELVQLRQYIKDWEEELEKEKNILELCISDYERQLKLQRRGASAKKAVEDAQRLVVNQRKAIINAQSTLNQKNLQIATLQAELKGAVSEEKQARINLERSVIRSPFDGRLKKLYIDHGELTSPGTKLFDIADDTKLEIPVSLDAREVAQAMGMIRSESEKVYMNWFKSPENSKVRIQWTEGPDLCEWEGRIERIKDFCANTGTVSFIVRPERFLKGKNGFFPLLSGMFCKVYFSGITLKNAVAVPWLAVQLDGNAYVINKEGRLEQREINVFPIKSEKAIIAAGLKNGDYLVVQRLPRGLINGMKVNPVNPATGKVYEAYAAKEDEKKEADGESTEK